MVRNEIGGQPVILYWVYVDPTRGPVCGWGCEGDQGDEICIHYTVMQIGRKIIQRG